MITGFNTDIKYGGVTYHVQTEDKGVDSPLILSLVYVGGAIIASKRTRYEDLISTGFDEKELTERLRRQHKLICAAIKAGRVDELKRMSAPNGGAKPEAGEEKEDAAPQVAAGNGAKPDGQRKKKSEPAPAVEAAAPPAEAPPPVEAPPSVEAPPPDEVAPPVEAARPAARVEPPPEQPLELPAEPPAKPPVKPPAKPPIKSPIEVSRVPAAAARAGRAEPEIVILTTLADEVSALGDFLYRPTPEPSAPPAAEVPPEEAAPIPVEPIPVTPLEEEEIEEPPQESNQLDLHLLDDEGDFRAGQLATVKVYVGRGLYGQRPVFDASVTVKVLGTSFRPIILTTATDENGVAVVRALLPRFNSGRAAIIIRATVGEDVAELRRIIRQ